MVFEQTSRLTALAIFSLVSLSAPGLAGAHGAPEADNLPEMRVQARITQQPDIRGLTAMILNAPRPGILFRYRGTDTLTVLGQENEDFLRFQGVEVWANAESPSWQALPNHSSDARKTGWIALSESGSFGWMDPRLAKLEAAHHDSEAKTWSIRVETASGDVEEVSGTLTFVPLSTGD